MIKNIKDLSILFLRVAIGWLMFYAGITKILNPDWSAEGFLNGAINFESLFTWLASPDILPFVNLLNEWGLTLIGLSLIIGIFVRWSSIFGALMMVLYYLPRLDFPYPDANSFIIDSHIIYILVFFILFAYDAGKKFGVDRYILK
ncbi:MAG: DoxX family protein [Candidatus Paceibacterota bacterium]